MPPPPPPIFRSPQDFGFLGPFLFASLMVLLLWGVVQARIHKRSKRRSGRGTWVGVEGKGVETGTSLLLHLSSHSCAPLRLPSQIFFPLGPAGQLVYALVGAVVFAGCALAAGRGGRKC